MLKVYSDGASRGNPGRSAIAFMVVEDGKVLKSDSRYLGIRTNNQAEYEALLWALECVLTLGSQEVTCCLDSLLVVKHLNEKYRVRDAELKGLWSKVKALEKSFREVSFVHVSRTDEHVQRVDSMVNQALDLAASRHR
jgi:ribonuclease HI